MRMRPIFWALLALMVALVDLLVLRGTVALVIYCLAGALGLIALIVSPWIALSDRDDKAAGVAK